jgi:hypothetical protein
MDISKAPNGQHVVVETSRNVFIGRMAGLDGTSCKMHQAAVHEASCPDTTEKFIRETARYGVDVQHQDLMFDTRTILRVRLLGEIPKS